MSHNDTLEKWKKRALVAEKELKNSALTYLESENRRLASDKDYAEMQADDKIKKLKELCVLLNVYDEELEGLEDQSSSRIEFLWKELDVR